MLFHACVSAAHLCNIVNSLKSAKLMGYSMHYTLKSAKLMGYSMHYTNHIDSCERPILRVAEICSQ